jgi:hypothetical protein
MLEPFQQSGTGATTRTVEAKLRDMISVKDFGAIGNGVTNDTAAIQAACNAAQAAGGKSVFFPGGIYQVSAVTIASGAVVNLIGEREQTLIRSINGTGNVITHNAWYSAVRDIKFGTSATRTAGSYLFMTGAHQVVEGCQFEADFTGITMTGVGGRILFNVFSNGATGARRIVLGGADTSQLVMGNLMNLQAPGVDTGIFIDNNGAVKIIGNDIVGQGSCVQIAPSTGQAVFSVYSSQNFYDSGSYGLYIAPIGSGGVYRCRFVGDWFGGHANSGALMNATGSGVVDGIDFEHCHFYGNTGNGITVLGLAVNVRMKSNRAKANSSGVAVGANVSKFYISDLVCSPGDGLAANAIGISIDTGASDYVIDGCDLRSQTLVNVSNHTPSATKIIRNTLGYATAANGSATVASGASTVNVTHGLAVTPAVSDILLTPTNDVTERWRVSATTSTTFTITLSASAAADRTFGWAARIAGA